MHVATLRDVRRVPGGPASSPERPVRAAGPVVTPPDTAGLAGHQSSARLPALGSGIVGRPGDRPSLRAPAPGSGHQPSAPGTGRSRQVPPASSRPSVGGESVGKGRGWTPTPAGRRCGPGRAAGRRSRGRAGAGAQAPGGAVRMIEALAGVRRAAVQDTQRASAKGLRRSATKGGTGQAATPPDPRGGAVVRGRDHRTTPVDQIRKPQRRGVPQGREHPSR